MDDTSSSSNHNKVTDESLYKIFSEMPAEQKEQLLAILTSKENSTVDNQYLLKKFVTLESLSSTGSVLKEHLPEDITEETLAKALAQIDNSQQTLADEQTLLINVFTEMFEQFSNTAPCDDINVIREFANASSIFEAFKQAGTSELSNFEDIISQDTDELLHAAMSCQIAGLTKNSQYLFKLFIQQQFIDQNESYQSLQTDINIEKGIIKTAQSHSEKGQNTRHGKNRQRKEFALNLYATKPYKNPKQAAERLFPSINDFSNKMNHPFTSEYQGFQTVYRWFLAANKQ
ncbi:hypothetical protein A9267_05675 [Shewanella sp. UCD-FRSSP16_17]|uniref:hypothetical protein n=1 Tax=Shewanella sp. UCD-FRSSP16_17 TaxID=1853256 RepID=UPI0007EE9DDE|nr:hypothetical protein [Shewanella sp. UCD-FRSSP16_17]OBT10366.1 hypothetical protein A9267_05675 [Shewanella sp. UCD-FRSSP16_17]